MLEYSEWAIDGLIDGYKKGEYTYSSVSKLTTNYLINGIITQEQADKVKDACPNPNANI